MNKNLLIALVFLALTGCDIWNVSPQPFPVWTAIPTRTPGIVTATPIIIIPSMTASPIASLTQSPGLTPDGSGNLTPTVTNTPTATSAPEQAVEIEILGCNTGVDITHGMGEVTNAYVTLKNTGRQDLPLACLLLRAADEDREHPDKRKCVPNLPSAYRVTFKLTVDSTYQTDTIIQVDASSDSTLLLRVDQQACRAIDIAGLGTPLDIGVIKPINP